MSGRYLPARYLLVVTFVGLALGPFTVGQISTRLELGGRWGADALREAVLWGLGAYAFAVAFLLLAARTLVHDEGTRVARATALGEPA